MPEILGHAVLAEGLGEDGQVERMLAGTQVTSDPTEAAREAARLQAHASIDAQAGIPGAADARYTAVALVAGWDG